MAQCSPQPHTIQQVQGTYDQFLLFIMSVYNLEPGQIDKKVYKKSPDIFYTRFGKKIF